MGEAVSAWEMAIQKEPHKGIYHKQLGDVYQAVERYQDAVGAYELARRKGDKTGDLLKSQLIAALYTDTSEAEKIAIRNADELYADPYMRKDRWILLWRVCAYAQRFGALPQGDKERARVRDIVKQGLEEIVARFPDAKSSFRVFLRQLLEPGFEGGDPNENDLEIFQHDSEITELIRERLAMRQVLG